VKKTVILGGGGPLFLCQEGNSYKKKQPCPKEREKNVYLSCFLRKERKGGSNTRGGKTLATFYLEKKKNVILIKIDYINGDKV